jgi:hypothetical protein
VDIIGLSIKATDDAQVCLMQIDNGWVQCQESAVQNDRKTKTYRESLKEIIRNTMIMAILEVVKQIAQSQRYEVSSLLSRR